MADQWNPNNPAVGNQIANDIPDIEEKLEFIKDILESICKQTWSDTVATTLFPTTMKDADADTQIQLEESADEDTIRFDIGGTEKLRLEANDAVFADGYDIQIDTIEEATAAAGVTIDGLQIKDGKLNTANCVDSAQYVDGSIDSAHLSSASVTTAKLSGALEEESTAATTFQQQTFTSVGAFGFFPQFKTSNVSCQPEAELMSGGIAIGTAYKTVLSLKSSGGYTTYARIRYVSASGDVWWMFFLVDKKTKKRISCRSGQEHPCYGSCKPKLYEHTFLDYDPAIHEIYVCTPSEDLLNEIKTRIPSGKDDVADRSILQVVNEDYSLDFDNPIPWPTKPIVVGFTKDPMDIKAGEKEEVVKMVIEQPDYIKTCGLKLKE